MKQTAFKLSDEYLEIFEEIKIYYAAQDRSETLRRMLKDKQREIRLKKLGMQSLVKA